MLLQSLNILNYKNIREANLTFSDKVNCFVGLNGQGKTNLLDAIYLLSFTKSAFSVIDSQNITHDQPFAMIQGEYLSPSHPKTNSTSSLPPVGEPEGITITCGIKRGQKKQFRRGQKDYKRLLDHIGLIPLVMVCPQDEQLIAEGSDERRRFMDVVISQVNRQYLDELTRYNALLKQRNAVLKQLADNQDLSSLRGEQEGVLEIYELQMTPLAESIYRERTLFIQAFTPIFNDLYRDISGGSEQVSLRYVSQLQDRNLAEAYVRTRQRDIILGWTSQGIHKDDIEMLISDYPLKRVGSQGQQKSYLLAMKLAQALYLSSTANPSFHDGETKRDLPILLLDDIFDKLDHERVERIIRLVSSDRFGQIFITDTDRQHLTDILSDILFDTQHTGNNGIPRIFHVHNGTISED